ncbi:hypothetical protein GQ43DRAFT_376247 [Delitschia confertaspora ATCC 74209]|uniref:CID domain-containing protein n=1 Tax=Delitschia confertaspora ATCC 74209 TaxID=1513339 RepID=A0A9P4JMD2_9PLEO|nr:hypothetical protein GQ43DRAFT_376247 [Delitschia confertaspora ATCC 74209]
MSLPSAEVAADFRDALQDLKVNSRPEISNLTIIAKESTEHAQAISRELENHIKTTRPEWKLPALYVLDSIVKNVGTPYTVYLGRNLYRTFMDAYVLVDEPTRKAMEGLLRTWKQPVPESMDPRPVFPVEMTRDIENSLIKFRTMAVQQAQRSQKPPMQQGLPPRPASNANVPWRHNPTPPQNATRYTPSNDPRLRQNFPPQHGTQNTPQMPPQNQFQPPNSGFTQPTASADLDTINADLDNLINSAKTDFAQNPSDVPRQQKLKTLLDLQTILKTRTLLPNQLSQIQEQIRQLAPPTAPAPSLPPSLPVPPPMIQSPQQAPPPFQATNPSFNLAQILAAARASGPPPPPAQANTSLADLLRRTSSPMQSSGTPTSVAPFPLPFPAAPMPPAPAPVPTPVPVTPTPAPSLAQILQQFGKSQPVPAAPPPPSALQFSLPQFLAQQPSTPANPAGGAEWLLNALKAQNMIPPVGASPFPPPFANAPPQAEVIGQPGSAALNAANDVELTTASMKISRPNLISKLYFAVPNQCVTCGRRFENTPQGKEKKARHMDWHFKVKDPDLSKRGIHRSWYISEREWIDYREVDETAPEQAVNGSGSAGAATAPKKETKDQYVPVPTDPTLVHAPCPICQERFEPQWLVEANDFVWMDAIKVNSKIYHATCWEEYSKGANLSVPFAAPATPDSVLGKRKAEGVSNSAEKKLRA